MKKGSNVLTLKISSLGDTTSADQSVTWDTDEFNITLNPPQARSGISIKTLTGAEGEEMRKKIYEQVRGKSGK